MALGAFPFLFTAHSAKAAVSFIRHLPMDDRAKKELVNEWFDLHKFSQRKRMSAAEAAELLYGQGARRAPPRLEQEMSKRIRQGGFLQKLIDTRRQAKKAAFEMLFGPGRLSRLMG